jgi:hypothetical protein
MQWLFQFWEEIKIRRTHIRAISGVRQCFLLVIGDNSLYSLGAMRSCAFSLGFIMPFSKLRLAGMTLKHPEL